MHLSGVVITAGRSFLLRSVRFARIGAIFSDAIFSVAIVIIFILTGAIVVSFTRAIETVYLNGFFVMRIAVRFARNNLCILVVAFALLMASRFVAT